MMLRSEVLGARMPVRSMLAVSALLGGLFCIGTSIYCGGRDRAVLERRLEEMTQNRDAWKRATLDDDARILTLLRNRKIFDTVSQGERWQAPGQ